MSGALHLTWETRRQVAAACSAHAGAPASFPTSKKGFQKLLTKTVPDIGPLWIIGNTCVALAAMLALFLHARDHVLARMMERKETLGT